MGMSTMGVSSKVIDAWSNARAEQGRPAKKLQFARGVKCRNMSDLHLKEMVAESTCYFSNCPAARKLLEPLFPKGDVRSCLYMYLKKYPGKKGPKRYGRWVIVLGHQSDEPDAQWTVTQLAVSGVKCSLKRRDVFRAVPDKCWDVVQPISRVKGSTSVAQLAHELERYSLEFSFPY